MKKYVNSWKQYLKCDLRLYQNNLYQIKHPTVSVDQNRIAIFFLLACKNILLNFLNSPKKEINFYNSWALKLIRRALTKVLSNPEPIRENCLSHNLDVAKMNWVSIYLEPQTLSSSLLFLSARSVKLISSISPFESR